MSQLPMLSAVQIATDRVLLRKARDADRERLIELQTDPEVWAYLGGPRLREAVEQRLDAIGPANVTATPGVFVIADKATDDLIGTLELKRRAADLPGLGCPEVSGQGPFEGLLIGPEETGATTEEEFLARVSG